MLATCVRHVEGGVGPGTVLSRLVALHPLASAALELCVVCFCRCCVRFLAAAAAFCCCLCCPVSLSLSLCPVPVLLSVCLVPVCCLSSLSSSVVSPPPAPATLAQADEGRPQRMRESRAGCEGCGWRGAVAGLSPAHHSTHPPALKRHGRKQGRTAGKWKAARELAFQRSPLFAVQARNQSWKDQAPHLLS